MKEPGPRVQLQLLNVVEPEWTKHGEGPEAGEGYVPPEELSEIFVPDWGGEEDEENLDDAAHTPAIAESKGSEETEPELQAEVCPCLHGFN